MKNFNMYVYAYICFFLRFKLLWLQEVTRRLDTILHQMVLGLYLHKLQQQQQANELSEEVYYVILIQTTSC